MLVRREYQVQHMVMRRHGKQAVHLHRATVDAVKKAVKIIVGSLG